MDGAERERERGADVCRGSQRSVRMTDMFMCVCVCAFSLASENNARMGESITLSWALPQGFSQDKCVLTALLSFNV